MNVLVIACRYYPAKNCGGPVVSIDNICNLLCDKISFYIVASDTDIGEKSRLVGLTDGWNERANCRVMYLSEKERTKEKYKSIINEVNPSLIYINSLFAGRYVIPFLKLARDRKIPVLLAPRGQLCKNAFLKKYKKIPYLLFFRRLLKGANVYYQYTSEEEKEVIEHYIRIRGKHLVSLPNVSFSSSSIVEKRKKVQGQLRIVFISRIHRKKNLHGALQMLPYLNGKVDFDVYGPKEDLEYWSECESLIQNLPPDVIVKYCGSVDHEDVYKVFADHDVFLFPTLSENYGHVIAEAMLSRCPVIISDQTPWTGICKSGAGWVYVLEDTEGFTSALQKLIDMDNDEYIQWCNRCFTYVERAIDIDGIKRQYKNLFFTFKQ